MTKLAKLFDVLCSSVNTNKIDKLMSQSQMRRVKRTNTELIYQHRDLPEYYIVFQDNGKNVYAESVISLRRFVREETLVVKSGYIDVDKDDLFEFVDKLSLFSLYDINKAYKEKFGEDSASGDLNRSIKTVAEALGYLWEFQGRPKGV